MITAPGSRELRSEKFPGVSIRVAAVRSERERAFQLVYQSYLRAELCRPSALGARITPHQLLASTDIIIAELRGEIISTLTLVRDGELGLPLEAIYPDEVRQRREAGLRVAEVSCLADRRTDPARYFALFTELARIMIQMADRDCVDQLLIAVHPRHAPLYRRAMAFTQVGENREYPSVKSNPAVALSLDLEEVKERRPKIWQRFAGTALPERIVERHPITERDRQYFLNMIHQSANNGEDALLTERAKPPQLALMSA